MEYKTNPYSASTENEVRYKSSKVGNYVRTGLLSLLVISAVASEGCMTWEQMTTPDPNHPSNRAGLGVAGALGSSFGMHGR